MTAPLDPVIENIIPLLPLRDPEHPAASNCIDGDGNRRREEESESKSCRGRSGMTFYPHGGLPEPKSDSLDRKQRTRRLVRRKPQIRCDDR